MTYAQDGRSNATTGDPHSAVYISNRVDLKNPATSLKVLVAAYRDASADFRVLYQLFREDGSETELAYELFLVLIIFVIQMEMVLVIKS